MVRLWILLLAVVVWVGVARAATIVLKDGFIVEGEIIAETSSTIRVKTRFDVRTIKRRYIDKIYDADPDSAAASGATAEFDALPENVRSLLNARADYTLGKYERVLERLERFADRPADAPNQSEILWLIIESHERLAQWDTAKEMIEAIKEDGSYQDQLRAKAHLSIFADNPQYDLRVVGPEPDMTSSRGGGGSSLLPNKVRARYFLSPELVNQAKEPNALADVTIMTKALEEYCDLLLRHEKTSVQAFERKLNLRATLDAVRELPKGADKAVVLQTMPYYEALLKTEKSIYKAQAVLPGYADAFALNLVRAEANHVINVLGVLFDEALQQSPYDLVLQTDPRTGRLTAEARRQWQQSCDEFLDRTATTVTLGRYLREKISVYPKELSVLREILADLFERLTQLRQSVARRRDRAD